MLTIIRYLILVPLLLSLQTDVSAAQDRPADLNEQLDLYANKAVDTFCIYVNQDDALNETLYETIIEHYTGRVWDLYASAQKLRFISLAFATERVTAKALYVRALIKTDPGEVRELMIGAKELWPNVEEAPIQIDGQQFSLKQLLDEMMIDVDNTNEIDLIVRYDPRQPSLPPFINVQFDILPGSPEAANLNLKRFLRRRSLEATEAMKEALSANESPVIIKTYLPPNLLLLVHLNNVVFGVDPAISGYLVDVFEKDILFTPNLEM
jgi:hypothetical protein